MRARNEAAWLSVLNTTGTELPPRSRINNLALAILVPCQATVTAIFFLVGRLNATAEVPAIHFRLFAFPAEDATAHFLCPVAADADRAVRTAGLASVCAMMPYR